MKKIIDDANAGSIPHKSVLVGGCFDVLHPGHLEFLEKSRNLGNSLCILLESDENIKILKGINRPLNKQIIRAENLSKLNFVDYIILLKNVPSSQYYYNLVKLVRPAIIAVTADDPLLNIKKEQANLVGGKVIEVMKRDTRYSSTKLIKK